MSFNKSPFPTEKTVKCPFCDNLQFVAVTATKIICTKCGNTFLVYDTSSMKHL